jgi:taurine--2-oxoglutarate transaminase
METVPGTNGGYFPPADYYRRLRELCDRSGILLVLDEVLTGFGRTGRWFACEEYGVVPDMMTLGKGITSGHAPLGAVAVHQRLARHFDDQVLATGLTHTAHPLSLAAALGNVEALEAEGLVERAAALGERLAERLRDLARHPRVADVRSRGLYGSIELRPESDALAVKRAALARGLHLAARPPYLFIAPPLVVAAADLEAGLDIVDQVLEVRS